MAIVKDQDLGTRILSSGGTTITLTTTNAVASGGFIIATISGAGTSSASMSGGGLSWNTDKNGAGAFGRQVSICSAQAPAGLAASTVLTATYDVSSPIRVVGATSFTGVKTSSPLDGTPIGPTDTASTTGWTTSSMTLAAGSMMFAVIQNQANNSGSTPTAPSVEPYEITSADPMDHVAEYRIESSAGSYAVAGTWGTAADATYIAAAYLAAAVAADTGLAWITA